MSAFRGSARYPAFWLAVGLPWPQDAQGGIAECALLTAPVTIDLAKLGPDAQAVYHLAEYYSAQSGHQVVMLGELTRWLGRHGQTWHTRGINFQTAYDELITAPLPGLYFALDQTSYIVLCDASQNGTSIYYPDGIVEKTPEDRDELRRHLTSTVLADWGPYIEPLIARHRPSA